MKIEEILKKSLGYSVVKPTGHRGGGCINQGESYEVDGGKKVFVKQNSDKIVSDLDYLVLSKCHSNQLNLLSGKENV